MPIGSLRFATRPSYRTAWRRKTAAEGRRESTAAERLRGDRQPAAGHRDQPQGREAATAAPAHGLTLRTILTMRRTVRLPGLLAP